MINNWFYSIISVKDNDIVVSNPYASNYSMSCLCDKARNMSLEYENVFISIYKHYLAKPYSVRLLYRFYNGRLVR